MLYLDVVQHFIGKDFGKAGVVPLCCWLICFWYSVLQFSIWYKLADRTMIGGYIALAVGDHHRAQRMAHSFLRLLCTGWARWLLPVHGTK